MVGPSVGTAKARPVNRAQRDKRVDIEIDAPAHNISGPNGWVTQRCALGEVGLRRHCMLNSSPRASKPLHLSPGEDGEEVSATSETLCEALHIIERGMAGPLLACRRRRARTFKEGGLRQNKNSDRAGIFCPTLQSHPHWTRW
jgi:hypothetical protein